MSEVKRLYTWLVRVLSATLRYLKNLAAAIYDRRFGALRERLRDRPATSGSGEPEVAPSMTEPVGQILECPHWAVDAPGGLDVGEARIDEGTRLRTLALPMHPTHGRHPWGA